MKPTYNFSAGPAVLPKEVLQQAQEELCNWHNLGSSVMEISHRSKEFIAVAAEAERDLRELLAIPDNYRVLFCQGGARAQFAVVPMNLLGNKSKADYIYGGYWANAAAAEAGKYGTANIIDIRQQQDGKQAVLPMNEWSISDDAAYIHYCPNETIEGLAIHEEPDFGTHPVVIDASSTLLSRPLDISRYGVIYAGAQKNIGPAGLTIVIVREDLIGQARKELPSVLDYQVLAKSDSMFNTPPTFAWYLSGLVFQWLKKQGGLAAMAERNRQKASHLYEFIDHSDFYRNTIATQNRSLMNVTFQLADSSLDKLFLENALAEGLHELKGHRVLGGMRASIYNAMPLAGVQALTQFMTEFVRRHG